GHGVMGRAVVLIGTGGAGSAIACALAAAGAASLTLCDVDQGKARALVPRIAAIAPGCTLRIGPATTEGVDILVNASPVGMKPEDGLPAPLGALPPHVVVADVVLKDATPLLRHARACGCSTVRGEEMMLGQVDEMLAFFGMAA